MSSQPTIIRAPRSAEHPYFACRRAPAQDEALSWEARGVLWYLLSKPDDWIILESDLMRGGEHGCGRDKVRRILRELESAGYLQRQQSKIRNDQGKLLFGPAEFLLTEIPSTEKPFTEVPQTPFQLTETPPTEIPLTENPRHTYKEISTDQQKQQTTEATDFAAVDDLSLSQQQQIAREPEAPNPALDDDPPAPPTWSEHETAIIQAECDRIGFNGLGLESLRAREAETALGLLYQVQTDGVRNPGGLLVEMLRAHSVPAAKHLKRAAYVLADADGSAPYEEPEEREDSAEHSTPDAAPPPAESITATGEPERGPEPAAPVGDGLDTVIAGRQVLELWRSALAQCRIEPDFFAAWFTDCQPMSYANGVLTVRPHDAEAQMRTGLYTPILNANLSRLAGTALRVQWFWPAPTGGAVEVADKLAVRT